MLTIGIATTVSQDLIVSYGDLPTALADAETAKDLEAFLAIDKSPGAIISLRTL